MASALPDFARIRLLGIDIDGTLTDGSLLWGGDEVGWTQRYAVRDGEALLRTVQAGVVVVPISRNKTRCARVRMEGLGLPTTWVGVADKLAALREVERHYGHPSSAICYVGDGREDAELFAAVAIGCCVPEAHPLARAAAHYPIRAAGGAGAVEEVCEHILATR